MHLIIKSLPMLFLSVLFITVCQRDDHVVTAEDPNNPVIHGTQQMLNHVKQGTDVRQAPTWQQEYQLIKQTLGDNPTRQQINEFIRTTVTELNRHAPVTADDKLEFVGASAGDNLLITKYRFLKDTPSLSKEAFKQYSIERQACQMLTPYHEYGIHAKYIYLDKHGNTAFDITFIPADCTS